MPQGYIKNASWVLRSVLQVSSFESKRTQEAPERSFGSFWHNGCPKDTSRRLHINFLISTIQESGRTPGFSRASSKCHPWSLKGCWRFMRGVLVFFDIKDAIWIHQVRYISIFRYLPSWAVIWVGNQAGDSCVWCARFTLFLVPMEEICRMTSLLYK